METMRAAGGTSAGHRSSSEARTLLRAAGLIRQAGDVAAEMPGVEPGFAAGVLASATLVESFAARAGATSTVLDEAS